MTKMGLEGLKARKSGIWGQNDVVLVHQRLFFFFNSRYNSKRCFGLYYKKKILRAYLRSPMAKKIEKKKKKRKKKT